MCGTVLIHMGCALRKYQQVLMNASDAGVGVGACEPQWEVQLHPARVAASLVLRLGCRAVPCRRVVPSCCCLAPQTNPNSYQPLAGLMR